MSDADDYVRAVLSHLAGEIAGDMAQAAGKKLAAHGNDIEASAVLAAALVCFMRAVGTVYDIDFEAVVREVMRA